MLAIASESRTVTEQIDLSIPACPARALPGRRLSPLPRELPKGPATRRHAPSTSALCTGSLILAAAGLLAGRRATSYWLALDELGPLGAIPVSERVVVDGKYVTAAGVSSGIDMGLTLAGLIAGDEVAHAIQLGIEYDPQPPYDAGSPDRAPAGVVTRLRSRSRFILT